MRRVLASIVLAAYALPVFAGRAPATAAEIQTRLTVGAGVEMRIDGEFNGDGDADAAERWRSDEGGEGRGLRVILADEHEGKLGWLLAGEVKLDPFPWGPGSMAIRKGVLVFEDLTGGTTATQSTRRYRYDTRQDRMRLIGIDVQRYSRTNSHGTVKLSWNLLDGKQIVQRGEPDTRGRGGEAVIYAKPEHGVHTASPIWMENSPDPDTLIDEQIAAEGEDRD